MKKIGNTDFANPEDIIEIRDKNQIIKAKVVIPDDAVHHKSLMKENYIEFSFNLDSYCEFLRGDYIAWQNTHYSLREKVIPEEVNSQNFKYKLKFEAKEMFLQDAQFYYMRQNLKESNWSLTAKATTFVKLVVDAANQYFGGDYYKVGTIEPAETLFLNFNQVSILSGLTQIAEKFNGEWYIADGYINLVKKIIFGSEIDFESEVSVASINRSDGQGEKPYNRILAFGSTRNIPSNYRKTKPNEGVDAIYQKRLRLPEDRGDVIVLKPNMSPEEVIEGTVIFEEVYPKRIGTMSEVTIIEKEEEDKSSEKETKWNAFRFKDEGLKFKNEYLLPKTELRIVFQSGDMNGLNFAVKFNPEDKPENKPEAQIFEIIPNEDYGKSLPNDTLKPNKGDTYILYGFDIKLAGDQYVPEAEEELYKTAIEWGKNNLRDKSVYDCQTIINHFAENEMDLEIGQKVKLIKNVGNGRNYLPQKGYNTGTHITNTITLSEGEYIASCSNCQFDNIQINGDIFINSNKFKLTKESVVTLYAVWGNNVPVSQDQIKCKIEKGCESTDWTPSPEDINEGIRSSRIMGFEKQLQNKYNAKYTVGDNAAYSRLSDLQGQIDEIKFAGNIFQQKGGNGVYLIKQFDYTAPSEFNTYSAKAQNARFLNKKTGGTVEEDTLFQKNLQVHGIAISDVFQNSTFTAGQFGSGFQIKRDSNGQSYLETDNLLVRREALFTSITKGEFKSLNMGIIISLADITVSKVEDNGNTWRCCFNNDGGKIKNKFAVNDQAICRKEDNGNVRYYWSLVTSVETDYIELSKTDKDGAGTPANNDVIIQLGNRTDVNRQHAIVLSAYGSDAPSIKQYSGINSYDLTDKEVTVISSQGNKFTGEFVIRTHGTTSPIYKDMGLFENGKAYYKNDRVSHLGSYWVCIVNNTIQIPNEDSAVWRKETAGSTDINNAINNIKVGGTNLLRGTATFTIGDINSNYAGWGEMQSETFRGNAVRRIAGTRNGFRLLNFPDDKLPYECTLSFYARVDSGETKFVSITQGGFSITVNSPKWKQYYVLLPAGTIVNNDGRQGIMETHSSNPVYISSIQLERGNLVSDWSAAPEDTREDINNAIDKIQIGGTNLFFNSTFHQMRGWEGEGISSWSATETSPFNSSCKILKWTGGGWYQRLKAYSWSETAQNFQKGITYTLSFYAKADTNLNINIGAENLSLKLFTLTPEWQRITYTFVGNGKATTIIFYGIGNWDVPKYMTQPKLEIGNKATDWSPATEDTDAKFAVVQSEFDSNFKVLKNQIESKVSRDDFNSLGNRLSHTESRVDQQTDRITSTIEKIDNIKIGGVNLLKGTSTFTLGDISPNYAGWGDIQGETFRGNVVRRIAGTWNGFRITKFANDKLPYECVLSFYARVDSGESKFVSITQGGFSITVNSKEWKQYSIVLPVGTIVNNDGRQGIMETSSVNPVYISSIQLERGNVTHDWSFANEDILAGINCKNRTYYQDDEPTEPDGGHNIGDLWIKKSLIDFDGNINPDTSLNIYQLQCRWNGSIWEHINWSGTRSAIKQTKDGIQLLTEKTGINNLGVGDTLKSLIDQTPEKISLAVQNIQIGGDNLFLNSSFNDMRGWEGESVSNWSIAGTSPFNSSCKVLGWTGAGWYQRLNAYSWNDTADMFQNGVNYTVSFYGRADGVLFMNFGPENLNTTRITLTSEWKLFTHTFVGDGKATTIIFYGSGNWDLRKYITMPKLVIGNKSSDWTPSAKDTKEEVLNEIASSFVIEKNEIRLASKQFKITGDTIAEALSAKSLEIGDEKKSAAALKVTADGTFFSKGSCAGSSLVIDSRKAQIQLQCNITKLPEDLSSNAPLRDVVQTTKIDATTGEFISIDEDYCRASLSSQGIFANTAGCGVYSFTTRKKLQASIAAIVSGKIDQAPNNFGITGVYGRAENKSSNPAPAYGGYFDMLRANGLCLNTHAISGDTILTESDVIISCYNKSRCKVTLPLAPYNGRTIYVRLIDDNPVDVVSSSANIRVQKNDQTTVYVGNRAGDGALFIWDGRSWLYNYIQA